jgi:large subunit ribosomal protein L10
MSALLNNPESQAMRPEKQSMMTEVQGRLHKGTCLIMVDCRGMKVAGMTDLRVRLRQTGARMQVVKNSYIKVAGSAIGMPDMSSLLAGPTAVIVGQGDVAALAKTVTDYAKENKMPRIKGGVLGSRTLQVNDIESIANLPSREILLSMAIGTMEAPIRNLVGVMHQKVASLLYALKAVAEQKEKTV